MVIAFITCYFGDLVSDIWLRVTAISVFIHNIRGAPVITLAAVITKGVSSKKHLDVNLRGKMIKKLIFCW